MTTQNASLHMDQIYRYQRYIYDVTRKHYLLGRDRLIKELAPEDNSTILEVGCGTGRNLIKAAKRYPNCHFYGFDISKVMLETAEQSIRRAQLSDRITLSYGDATNFDATVTFGIPYYDRVFISYALTMIPPWREALDHSMTFIAPGGSLHVIDFGQQEHMPKWFRNVLYAWLRQFSVYPQADLKAELEKAATQHNTTLSFQSLYRGYAEYAVLKN